MAYDLGVGVALLEGLEDFVEELLLFGGAGVMGLALLVEAAFVADAEGVGVVALDVAAGHRDGAAVVEGAVTPDIEVIAGMLAEAAQLMAADQAADAEALRCLRGGAMEDKHVNRPRRTKTIRTQQG